MAYKPRKDIKVPESYIQKLRDAGTKKAALEKYGTSTDPKMREALRRFYGANSITPLGASSRSRAQSRPRSSVPMPKSVSQTKPKGTPGSRGSGPVVQNRRSAAPTTKAPNRAAANRGVSMKQVGVNVRKFDNVVEGAILAAIPAGKVAKVGKAAIKSKIIAKNTKKLKTAKGSEANLARTRIGKAKGLATKGEVRQAKAAVNRKGKGR
jgi:hypothetical protein